MSEEENNNSSNSARGSTSQIIFSAIIALCVGLIFISKDNQTQFFDKRYKSEVYLIHSFVGMDHTKSIYTIGEKIGSKVDVIQDQFKDDKKILYKIKIPYLLERIPELIKWLIRRYILSINIIVLTIILGITTLLISVWNKLNVDIMDKESQTGFEVGRLLIWTSSAFIFAYPLASIPNGGLFFIGTLAFSALPLIVQIFKVRLDYLMAPMCILLAQYTGPWGQLFGTLMFCIGIYLLIRFWPSHF